MVPDVWKVQKPWRHPICVGLMHPHILHPALLTEAVSTALGSVHPCFFFLAKASLGSKNPSKRFQAGGFSLVILWLAVGDYGEQQDAPKIFCKSFCIEKLNKIGVDCTYRCCQNTNLVSQSFTATIVSFETTTLVTEPLFGFGRWRVWKPLKTSGDLDGNGWSTALLKIIL